MAKKDLRAIAQEIMGEVYTDRQSGKQMTGEQILKHGLIANISNPNGKNWAKSVELMIHLTGADITPAQRRKMKADADLAAAKARELKMRLDGMEDDDDEL